MSILKIAGGFYAELINIWKMGQTDTIEDIIKDFIAFGIIAEIDDLIANGIKGFNAAEEVANNPIEYHKSQNEKTLV